MAIPTTTNTWTTYASSVLEDTRQDITDAIFKGTPLLAKLRENKQEVEGGRYISRNVMYGKNTTFKGLSEYGVFDTTPQPNTTTHAEYDWKIEGGTIVVSQAEIRRNKGKNQVFSLFKEKIDSAKLSLRDFLNTTIWASSTAALDFNSIRTLLTAAGTGTIGGINSTTETWWQNQKVQSVGAASVNLVPKMRVLHNTITNGTVNRPHLWVFNQTQYEALEEIAFSKTEFQTGLRPENTKQMSDLGFDGLSFKGVPVVYDPNCPDGSAYAINFDFLYLVVNPEADLILGDFKEPTDQTVLIAKLLIEGQIVTDNRRYQGVLSGIT